MPTLKKDPTYYQPPFPHQADPSEDLSEHDKQIIAIKLQDASYDRTALLKMSLNEPSATIRRELSWVAIHGKEGDPKKEKWNDAQIELVREIIETDECEWVYYHAMRYFLDLETSQKANAANHLRKIAMMSKDPFRRIYAADVLAHASNVKKIEQFIKDRILTDESNYVRMSIANHCVGWSKRVSPSLKEFAIQWFHHTRTGTTNGMLALEENPIQPNFFQHERRPLLSPNDPYAADKPTTESPQSPSNPSIKSGLDDGTYSTNQNTSKRIKIQILLSWALGIVSLFTLLLAPPEYKYIGIAGIVVTVAWKSYLKFRRWWHHG